MHDRIQIRLTPRSIFLHLLDLALVCPFEDPIAGNVVPLSAHVFTHSAQSFLVVNTGGLKKSDQIIDRVMAVWASMGLANADVIVTQDFLARVGWISAAPAINISTNITIRVANVVLVLGVEFIIRLALEGLAPKEDTLLQRQTNTLQEEGVLKSPEVLQVIVLA